MNIRLASAALFFVGAAFAASAQTNWSVKQSLPVGGEGGWDYATIDASGHRLFVTRTTHTQAIDIDSGKLLGDIPGMSHSHGVALVPRLNRGFITDGGNSGAIVVFDLTTYAVLGRLAAMPDSDGILYDEKSDLVLSVSGDGHALFAFHPDIDLNSGTIFPPIKLPGAPEFLAVDGAGRAYVNLVEKDTVAVVDLRARKVIAQWPVAPGGHPVGMAIDATHRRLFVGCRNPQKLVVMSADTGAIEAALPIGAGVDATAVVNDQAFASCRDGSLTVAGEVNGKFAVVQTVKTDEGARTMAATDRHIYLPTADLESPSGGRSKPKPGTFKIIVVEAR